MNLREKFIILKHSTVFILFHCDSRGDSAPLTNDSDKRVRLISAILPSETVFYGVFSPVQLLT